jgi:hypothetical protein
MTCACVCDLAGAAGPRVENVKMAKNAQKKTSLWFNFPHHYDLCGGLIYV